MNRKRVIAAVAGALVAGVVLGTAVSGFAAAPKAAGSTGPIAAACATGLRLGASMRDSGGRLLDVVAKLTGLAPEAVTAQRQQGKTFTQIAAEKGVDSSKVVAEALKVRETVLAEKVAAGDITKAQADTALATMKTRLAAQVDNANAGCSGNGAGGGRGAGGGCGGGGCGGGAGRASSTQ